MTNKYNFFNPALSATLAVAFLAMFTPASPVAGADAANWQVKEAPVRFKVSMTGKPTEKSAGYLVILPDGGILPGPAPLPSVVTEGGKQIPSYVMWHSRGSGVAIVFEDPGTEGDVFIYISGTDKAKLWSPQTGLTPGPIICAEQGTESLDVAKNLARLGPIGPRSYFQKYGTSSTPLGMQGDVQGRSGPICYYMLAYVVTKDPGKTLVALSVFNGIVQIHVDGQTLNPQRVSSKFGGTGQWMDLAKGLHKVEAFSSIGLTGTSKEKEQSCNWLMGWKPPNAKIEDLGGPRPKDLPAPGTPMWESHKINPEEIVKSGICKVREVNSKDGSPVAQIRLESTDTFWFGEEAPVFTYELSALAAGNPEDTQYAWSFNDKARLTGPKVAWFYSRGDQTVTLTASSGGKQSVCTLPFYAYSGTRSSLDSESTRDNFRNTCYSTLKAYPPEADPTTTWNTTMWNCFQDSQEFGKGHELLDEVLTKRWTFFQKKVPAEKQSIMEDIFFNWIAQNDTEKAIKWLGDQERVSTNMMRKSDLKIMLAEIYMYQKPNLAEAKKILLPISKGTGEAAATATVRLGDIAFLERNISEANNYWQLVQNKVKLNKETINGEGGEVNWDDGSGGKKKKNDGPAAKAFASKAINTEKVADWRKSAVVDTSKALSVITLIQQGFLMEAYQQLRSWERVMPMSKISGDYMIQEAKFYLGIGNSKRSRMLLEAYCENIDASSYVADAAEVLLNCMMKDKESDKAIKKFCEDMKKRFEFHPLAERMTDLMRVMGADGIKREATLDKL